MHGHLSDRRAAQEFLIRKTRSVCPDCIQELDADILFEDGVVVMRKHCPKHGDRSVILSREAMYYSELSRAFFLIMPASLERRHIALTLTKRCSLNCPICFAIHTIGKKSSDMSLEDVEEIVRSNPKKDFMLWGMEPTEHPQISEVLSVFKRHGKKCHMLTNGVKLQDGVFLEKLRRSGLGQVCLQFDGFDDDVFKTMRGKALLDIKTRVLDNLKKVDIPTSLEVVLMKGVNEGQISKIIDYAAQNPFIRQVNFSPLIYRGELRLSSKMSDPGYQGFLETIEVETRGRITVDKMKAFQKLMYVVYRLTRFKRCMYFNLYILIRNKTGQGYRTIDEFIDLPAAEKIIDDALDKLKGAPGLAFDISIMFKLAKVFLNRQCGRLLIEYLRFVLGGRKLGNSRSIQGMLFITYNEFCDTYKMDIGMSEAHCQDVVVTKDREGRLSYKPCYRIVTEDCVEKKAAVC